MKDAVYDSQAIRRFVGIDLDREAAPVATTLLKFRRLLMRESSIVDAKLVTAPSRPKTTQTNAIRKYIRPRRGTNGTSG